MCTSGHLIQIVVREHIGLPGGLFLLFPGGCGFSLFFQMICEFHDHDLRLKFKVKSLILRIFYHSFCHRTITCPPVFIR